jgi:hypothetical protein
VRADDTVGIAPSASAISQKHSKHSANVGHRKIWYAWARIKHTLITVLLPHQAKHSWWTRARAKGPTTASCFNSLLLDETDRQTRIANLEHTSKIKSKTASLPCLSHTHPLTFEEMREREGERGAVPVSTRSYGIDEANKGFDTDACSFPFHSFVLATLPSDGECEENNNNQRWAGNSKDPFRLVWVWNWNSM